MPDALDLSQLAPDEVERRLSHRRRVRASYAARAAAWTRLAEAHPEEFIEYHEEEKAARGIQSRRLSKTSTPAEVESHDPDPMAA